MKRTHEGAETEDEWDTREFYRPRVSRYDDPAAYARQLHLQEMQGYDIIFGREQFEEDYNNQLNAMNNHFNNNYNQRYWHDMPRETYQHGLEEFQRHMFDSDTE